MKQQQKQIQQRSGRQSRQKPQANNKLLFIDFNRVETKELIATTKEITDRLFIHFRQHIGADNPTNPQEIFKVVLEVEADSLSIFKREYFWGVVKRVMCNLRSSGDLFVIHRGNQFFVLCNKRELGLYKNQLDNSIKNLKKGKKRAENWVRGEKWRDI